MARRFNSDSGFAAYAAKVHAIHAVFQSYAAAYPGVKPIAVWSERVRALRKAPGYYREPDWSALLTPEAYAEADTRAWVDLLYGGLNYLAHGPPKGRAPRRSSPLKREELALDALYQQNQRDVSKWSVQNGVPMIDADDTRNTTEAWLEEHGLSVDRFGLVNFDTRDRETRRIVGHLPVAVYHHTSSSVLPRVKVEGLRGWRETGGRANDYMNTGAGVYVTTETSGPVVRGYHQAATRTLGGRPVTLTLRTSLDHLARDPDDVDLSVGSRQFVLPHVAPRDIVDGLKGVRSAREGRR